MPSARFHAWSLALVAASVLPAGVAHAQTYEEAFREPAAPPEPPPPPPATVWPVFGSRGQWAVGGSSSLGVSSESFSNSRAVFTSAAFNPGVDWFPVDHLSVGLRAGASYADDKGYGADGSVVETKRAAVRVGARVGVVLPLGSRVSVWPRAAAGFEWTHQTVSLLSGTESSVADSPLGLPTSTTVGPYVGGSLGVLFHVTPHFFLGVEPAVHHGFGAVQESRAGGQETEVSFGLVVGGWFGGAPPAPEASSPVSPAPPPARERRFGQAHQFVFSNELALGGQWTQYAGTSSSSSSGAVAVGVDHFLADHVSLGAAFAWSGAGASGIDPTTGALVTSHSSGGALSARIGVDLPLGKLLSLWARGSFSFGERTTDEQESAGNHHDLQIISVALDAPLLVHPTTHFFVGLGPFVTHDLMRADVTKLIEQPGGGLVAGGSGAQNLGTTVGASFVLGGWL